MSLKEVIEEGNQFRLSWRGILGVIGGTILIGLLFLYFGRFELTRPTLFSVGMIGIAISIKWKLRRHMWFWAAIATIAALHIPLILYLPWTTSWIPALVATPICAADLVIILAVIRLLEKHLDKSIARDAGASSPS
ncbi:MAG TPA: hypothetical protein VJR23_03645 [Candidatus Acidoferrales bacterium]|nr:hypothetical protein [Candidatus Acidoferrales bacterium]